MSYTYSLPCLQDKTKSRVIIIKVNTFKTCANINFENKSVNETHFEIHNSWSSSIVDFILILYIINIICVETRQARNSDKTIYHICVLCLLMQTYFSFFTVCSILKA